MSIEELKLRFEEAVRIYTDKDPGMKLIYEDLLEILNVIQVGKLGFQPPKEEPNNG